MESLIHLKHGSRFFIEGPTVFHAEVGSGVVVTFFQEEVKAACVFYAESMDQVRELADHVKAEMASKYSSKSPLSWKVKVVAHTSEFDAAEKLILSLGFRIAGHLEVHETPIELYFFGHSGRLRISKVARAAA